MHYAPEGLAHPGALAVPVLATLGTLAALTHVYAAARCARSGCINAVVVLWFAQGVNTSRLRLVGREGDGMLEAARGGSVGCQADMAQDAAT